MLDAATEFFHLCPMHFWTEMVLGVITIVEEQPVIDFSVTAHAPGNRFVGIGSVMAIVAVQITETMTEIPERQEKQNESPVNEMNRIRRNDDRHDQESCGESRQLKLPPNIVAVLSFLKVLANRADIITKETQKNIAPRVFGFAVVAVSVDR